MDVGHPAAPDGGPVELDADAGHEAGEEEDGADRLEHAPHDELVPEPVGPLGAEVGTLGHHL